MLFDTASTLMLIRTLIFLYFVLFSSMEERIWNENDYYLSQVSTEIYRLLSGPLIVCVSHEQISEKKASFVNKILYICSLRA